MTDLDNFVYDSQFQFLPIQEQLQEIYFKNVLSKSALIKVEDIKVFIRREEWDSRNFGRNFARVIWMTDEATTSRIKLLKQPFSEFDCVYLRLNAEHSFCEAASAEGFKPLSTKISQHVDLGQQPYIFDTGIEYKLCIEGDESSLSQVLAMSSNSFMHSRFRNDPFFKKDEIDEMYVSWLKNELKEPECKLYVTLEGSEVTSFVLYRTNVSPAKGVIIGFVSLIASSPAFRKRKYASNLLRYVMNVARTEGTRYIIANTESTNVQALDFFAYNRFKVTSKLNEYHLWN
jgi:hypothetical protein